jgi:hypothetical protein
MLRNRLSIQVVAAVAFVFCAGVAQSQNGTITTFAGGGNPTGSPTLVPIGQPWSVVQDSSGNTYIADNHSNRIFEVSNGTISVIAGDSADGLTPGTQTAINTSLSFPQGLALYGGGLYIADDGNNEIRVVNVSASPITVFPSAASPIVIQPGQIADVAGLQGGALCIVSVTPTCNDGQFATSAGLNAPADVVLDSTGDIFIADTGDNVIREVNGSTGIISRIAGTYCNKSCTGGGDGGSALSASFNTPTWISLDSSGNVYIADTNDDAIRVVNTSSTTTLSLFGGSLTISPGDIYTVAGSKTLGTACASPESCGDSGKSTSALLNAPGAVLVDSSSDIYIADSGDQVVREVNGTTGIITLLAGTYFTNCSPVSSVVKCGDGSPANAALLNNPTAIFLSTTGSNVFIADELDATVREFPIGGGDISTFAGVYFNRGYYGNGGLATSAELQNPVGVAADSSGDLFIADTPSNVIREVSATTGDISTVVGSLTSCLQSSTPLCGDGLAATSANLWLPSDVFADSAGNLYIADTMDNVIRKVTAQTGFISTVAGNDTSFSAGFGGDGGPATAASVLLNNPSGVFVDSNGNIFIADTANNRIREVTASNGNINTIAGDGTAGYTGDGSAATGAELKGPTGVSLDVKGNIYITDSGNNVIRMVDTTGTISTVAGNGTAGFSGDNTGPATSAELWSPWGAFVDFLGNLFISDQQNDVIRVANLSTTTNTVGGIQILAGQINTVVGSGQNGGFAGDNGPASAALIHQPLGMRSDSAGNLYFADRLNWRVRKVSNIVATTPTAILSTTGPLTFASQVVGSSSAEQSITVTNNGNISPLQYTIGFTGADPGDFLESDSCNGSVASNGQTCTLNVTFKPTAVGTRSASMTITDTAAGIAESVALSGTATQATTTTTLKSSANPSGVGQLVTFTATVTPSTGGTPTGSVTFKDGSTTLVSAVTLTSGVATLAISTLTQATHSITAVYSGDANYIGSTSAALSQVVTKATTTTTLKSSANPSDAGQSVTLTATVTAPTGGTPTGSVTFNDGSTALGSAVTLASGTATLAITTLTAATHSITGVYSGDANYNGSTSAVLSQVVDAPFSVKATALSPSATISPGGSATSTITLTSANSFSSAVTLTCAVSSSVTPAPSNPPGCTVTSPVTLAANKTATSTLTVTSTAATSALIRPAILRPSMPLYAVWLWVPAMLLSTAGLGGRNQRKLRATLLRYVFILLALTGCLFLAACGGGGSSGSTGTGGSGTSAGAYTVTVTASATGVTSQTTTMIVTVQ